MEEPRVEDKTRTAVMAYIVLAVGLCVGAGLALLYFFQS